MSPQVTKKFRLFKIQLNRMLSIIFTDFLFLLFNLGLQYKEPFILILSVVKIIPLLMKHYQ